MSLGHNVKNDGPRSGTALADRAPRDPSADKALDSDGLFDRLFDVAKQLTLPRSSWAVHCVDKDGVRDIVFSQVLVKHAPKVTALRLPKTVSAEQGEITTVYCPKTVAVKSDASVTVSLMGVPLSAVAGVPIASPRRSLAAPTWSGFLRPWTLCASVGEAPTRKCTPELNPSSPIWTRSTSGGTCAARSC